MEEFPFCVMLPCPYLNLPWLWVTALLSALSQANAHDAPFAQLLLAWAVRLYQIHPRVVRLDAAYWGLRLIAWIHAVLGAVAVIPWSPKRQKNRTCLPPTCTKEELGKRSAIERFFGRVFLFFHETSSTFVWLVCCCFVGRSDLYGFRHRWSGYSACWPF
jgi:transposase